MTLEPSLLDDRMRVDIVVSRYGDERARRPYARLDGSPRRGQLVIGAPQRIVAGTQHRVDGLLAHELGQLIQLERNRCELPTPLEHEVEGARGALAQPVGEWNRTEARR